MACFMTQFQTLCRRNFITARRDPGNALAHIIAPPSSSHRRWMFLSSQTHDCWIPNRVGSMYFLFILLSFSALSAATAFSKARPLSAGARKRSLRPAVLAG